MQWRPPERGCDRTQLKIQVDIANLLYVSTSSGFIAGTLENLGVPTPVVGGMVAAVPSDTTVLLAKIIFFCVTIDSLWSLSFLFLFLSFCDRTQDSLNSFHFLAVNLMPLSGSKTVLHGVETSISTACGYRGLLHRIKVCQQFLCCCSCIDTCYGSVGEKNDAVLISAREWSLLIYYVLLPINSDKAIFSSRKQTAASMSAHTQNRK